MRLLVERYGEDVRVGTMADGEGAGRSGIAPCPSGDCKDIGAAEWWRVWKPAIESPAVDGDLTVSKYERKHTLLSLETGVVDRCRRLALGRTAHRACEDSPRRQPRHQARGRAAVRPPGVDRGTRAGVQ